MLTTDQLIELEIIAHEQVAEVESQLAALKIDTTPVAPDVALGRLTRNDAMQMQQMALAAQARLNQRLFRLNQALQKMDEGNYGRCQQCGDEIPYDRLEASPEAPLCGTCAR